LEAWNERAGAWFDFNELRAQLGLPTLGPIDPEESPLAGLPLVRWPRVMVEKLSDADLQAGFRRASSFNAPATAKRFAQAILDRPGVSDLALRQMALQTAAKLADDSDEALRYMNLGREEAQKAGVSCASWDLREMALRFERGEADQFARLFEHLQQRHLREGGVREALGNLLVRFGLVRPDGTVAIPAQAAPAPAIVVPGQEGAEPGKLWMPESQKPAGDKPKIWMPGDQ